MTVVTAGPGARLRAGRHRLAAVAAVVALLTACGPAGDDGGAGEGPATGTSVPVPADVSAVDVPVPGQAGRDRPLSGADELAVAPDGTEVVLLRDLHGAAVVRVSGGEVVSRAEVAQDVTEVVPRADGSVVVIGGDLEWSNLLVGVLLPGGDPGGVAPVPLVPVSPELVALVSPDPVDVGGTHAVLAADGRTVIVLVERPWEAVLLALDPDTGRVLAERVLGAGLRPVDLFPTGGGAGVVAVVTGERTSEVVRLPADLSGVDPVRVVLDGPVRAAAQAPDGTVHVVAPQRSGGETGPDRYDAVVRWVVPPGATVAQRAEVAVGGWPALPGAFLRIAAVDPSGELLYLAGHQRAGLGGRQPVVVAVDLRTGAVAEPVALAGAGWVHGLAVADDAVRAVGTTAGGRGETPTLWRWPPG